MKNVTWEKFSNLTNVNAALSPSGALTVIVDVLGDVNHPFAHTKIYVDSGNGQYDFEIMNRTVNFCEFFRNKGYEPLLQIFYKILLENGPWPTACPIRKVIDYNIQAFHANSSIKESAEVRKLILKIEKNITKQYRWYIENSCQRHF